MLKKKQQKKHGTNSESIVRNLLHETSRIQKSQTQQFFLFQVEDYIYETIA